MAETRYTVLVVDDEPAHLELIQRAFAGAGSCAAVKTAGTMREYGELAAAGSVDIALIDLHLPDGSALNALISPLEDGPFPILIMTARGGEAAAVSAMKAGALDYIVKSPEAFARIPETTEQALRQWSRLLERRRAEASARVYLDLVDAIIVAIGADARVIQINRAGCRILGWREEEAVGKDWFENMLPERVRADVRGAFEGLMAGGPEGPRTFENPVLTKSGEERIILWTNTILRNPLGQITGTLSSGQDITERKRAEEQVLATQRLLDEAGAIGKVGGWQLDIDTGKQLWAKEVYAIHEVPPGFVPTLDNGVSFYTPDSRPIIEQAARRTIEKGEPFDLELQIRTAKGNLRDVRSMGWADLEHRSIYGFFQDITEHKRKDAVESARLRLLQFSDNHTLDELLEETLNEAEALTGSLVGFYHFVEADQKTLSLQNWSTRTKKEYCKAQGKGSHYDISRAGVWVDCVRERRPVIHNDYASLPHKKGLPPGHAPLVRELVVPVIRDGKLTAILGVGNKPSDYDGQDVKAASLLCDLAWEIVRRKRTEEAAKESLRLLGMAQRVARMGSYVLEFGPGRWTSTETLDDIFGIGGDYNRTVQGWLDLVAPDCREELADYFVREVLGKGARFDRDYRIIRVRDGQERWVHGVGELEFDPKDPGGPLRMVGTISDITERKRNEEKIDHLNRVLRAIRNVTGLIIHENDPRRLINEASRLLVEQRGYSHAMIIIVDEAGKPREHAAAGFGDEFEAITEGLRRGALPPCCAESAAQARFLRIEDHARTCGPCPAAAVCSQGHSLCLALRGEGALLGYMLVGFPPGVEVTAEEQSLFIEVAEDLAFALRGIAQEKARLSAEKERENMRSQLRQSQRMEVVGRLAGGVAHDFNNLITAILGNCTFLLADIPKDDPRRADVEEIRKAGERAANLTRQLLAFSRKQVLRFQVLDMNSVLTDMERLLRRIIGEDIDLRITRAEDLAPVKADPGQMEQVVMNLAVNARDAMGKGGRLSIETGNLDLPAPRALSGDVQVPPGRYVLMTVGDTGSGMEPEVLERIFEPFFTTKETGKGTGLGLATVYGIIKQSGGHIYVRSAPGQGTTFQIFLPVTTEARLGEGEGEGEGHRKKKEWGQKSPGTILLVEDDEVVRRVALRILSEDGYCVIEAKSGEEALTHAEECYDLVLADIVLPDISGVEVAARLKSARPSVRVIYTSGYADSPDIREIVSRPENRFLQKPFTAQALRDMVREALA